MYKSEKINLPQAIEAIRKGVDAALNSRQARRERVMCAILASPLVDRFDLNNLAAEAEDFLDASDAVDRQEGEA